MGVFILTMMSTIGYASLVSADFDMAGPAGKKKRILMIYGGIDFFKKPNLLKL